MPNAVGFDGSISSELGAGNSPRKVQQTAFKPWENHQTPIGTILSDSNKRLQKIGSIRPPFSFPFSFLEGLPSGHGTKQSYAMNSQRLRPTIPRTWKSPQKICRGLGVLESTNETNARVIGSGNIRFPRLDYQTMKINVELCMSIPERLLSIPKNNLQSRYVQVLNNGEKSKLCGQALQEARGKTRP